MSVPESLSQFRSQVVEQAGEVFFPAAIIADVLRHCEDANLAIDGIEGFIVSPQRVEPQLDLIGDCGRVATGDWQIAKTKSRECAARVVEAARARKSVHFTLEFLSQQDWERRRMT